MLPYEVDVRANAYRYSSMALEAKVRVYNAEVTRCTKRGVLLPQPASFGIGTFEVNLDSESGTARLPWD